MKLSSLSMRTPRKVFAFVDDHARFSSHMSESSWMMGGGRMAVETDAAKGQAVGSHIRLSGRVWGVTLSLDEVVTRREPPTVKAWETIGTPRLLVVGAYEMAVQISPSGNGSQVRVSIGYEFPTGWATRWLGLLFGGFYARWCVAQMLTSVGKNFAARHNSETRATLRENPRSGVKFHGTAK